MIKRRMKREIIAEVAMRTKKTTLGFFMFKRGMIFRVHFTY
jgi:hypothetical protein